MEGSHLDIPPATVVSKIPGILQEFFAVLFFLCLFKWSIALGLGVGLG